MHSIQKFTFLIHSHCLGLIIFLNSNTFLKSIFKKTVILFHGTSWWSIFQYINFPNITTILHTCTFWSKSLKNRHFFCWKISLNSFKRRKNSSNLKICALCNALQTVSPFLYLQTNTSEHLTWQIEIQKSDQIHQIRNRTQKQIWLWDELACLMHCNLHLLNKLKFELTWVERCWK